MQKLEISDAGAQAPENHNCDAASTIQDQLGIESNEPQLESRAVQQARYQLQQIVNGSKMWCLIVEQVKTRTMARSARVLEVMVENRRTDILKVSYNAA